MLATVPPIPADETQRESRQVYPVPTARGSVPSQFCEFLQGQGGLHLWFAEFLQWRADLVRARTLLALQTLPKPAWTLSREEASVIVCADLGEVGAAVAATLSATPFWNDGLICVYRARLDLREVVLQFSRSPFTPVEFKTLERSLAGWRGEIEEWRFDEGVFLQFREWLRVGLSASAGRRLLHAVQEYKGDAVTLFPEPIDRLCSERVLGYTWLEGRTLTELVTAGVPEASQKWCETMLEQVCLFSVVDAGSRLDNLVLTSSGQIGLRIPPRFLAVPAVHVRRMLKYISSVFAGNVPAAAHALLRMSGSEGGDDPAMLDALASVEPDLKVNLAFPPSGAHFENHWRALAALQKSRPLFLDCLHRNLIAAGFAAAHRNTGGDPLEQAHWPVLGRLLRTRMGALFTRESASDWMMGSGLLMVEAMRQMGRLVEDFRDDDVALRVNLSASGGQNAGSRAANLSAARLIAGGALLTILLLSLRWGFALSGAWSAAAAAVGVLAAIGLFLVVSQIE